jgi:predicted transcriptional regulator
MVIKGIVQFVCTQLWSYFDTHTMLEQTLEQSLDQESGNDEQQQQTEESQAEAEDGEVTQPAEVRGHFLFLD